MGNANAEHPVIKLIKERHNCNSKPGFRKDPFKLGLVIEGGGMRGVVSAGMVSGLHYLGLINVFDVVYGTSAGAINGAYFLAGQAPYGTTIYYENINNNRFINSWRILSKTPVMSLEFLLYHVAEKEKILDCERIVKSPIPLKVFVSSVTKLKAVVLENFQSKKDLINALRATARLPIAGGPPIEINGDKYLDGGIYESIPYRKAVEEGCTHIFTLLTRPDSELRGRPSLFEKTIVRRYLEKINRGLGKAFIDRPKKYCDDIQFLGHATENPIAQPYHFAVQQPRGTFTVNRMEKKRDKLIYGARKGMEAIINTINNTTPAIMEEILCPFDEYGHKMGGGNCFNQR